MPDIRPLSDPSRSASAKFKPCLEVTLRIVISAPPEPSWTDGPEGQSLAEVVREALLNLNGADHRWATTEKALADELARGGDVLIIADATVRERQIRRILELRPPPVVVVTPDPAAMALALRSVAVQEILEPHAESLALAIRRLAETALLARTARAAAVHPRLSRTTGRWMALTLTAGPPYGSVSAAAKDLHVSPSTLSVHWGQDIGGSSPKEWLEWIQLVRAIECRRGTVSWTKVAGQLRISMRTLERIGWRCTDCRLSQLDADPEGPIRDAERYFAAVLSGESPHFDAESGILSRARRFDAGIDDTSA